MVERKAFGVKLEDGITYWSTIEKFGTDHYLIQFNHQKIWIKESELAKLIEFDAYMRGKSRDDTYTQVID